MLVEVTGVDQLVERLKKGKYRDRDSVIESSTILCQTSYIRRR